MSIKALQVWGSRKRAKIRMTTWAMVKRGYTPAFFSQNGVFGAAKKRDVLGQVGLNVVTKKSYTICSRSSGVK